MRTLGEYLSLSFVASLGLLAAIGFQSRIKAEFWRAFCHAFLFSLCLMTVFGVLLAILFDFGWADMKPVILLFLVPLAGLCPETGLGILPIPVLWALYLGLMAVSLGRVRKAQTRPAQITGQIAVFVAFGIAYAVGWFFATRALGSALAAAALMSFM